MAFFQTEDKISFTAMETFCPCVGHIYNDEWTVHITH